MKIPTLLDAEQYVGREYVEGVFDCVSLAVLVQDELFGRHIAAPAAGERRKGRRGQAGEIQRLQPGLADRIEEPSTGDAVLIYAHTAAGKPPYNRHWHLGTVFVQAGEKWVLHCANQAQGVLLQRLDQMLGQALHLDGFYAWRDAPPAADVVSAPKVPRPPVLDLAIAAHPLMPGVEVRQALAGRTLAETLLAEGITGTGWRVSVGGLPVAPEHWHLIRVKPGHLIEAQAIARKRALAIVAVLVLSYFTAGIGAGAAAGTLGSSFAAGTIGAAALSAAVFVGGSMLINKVLGPKAASAGDNTGNQPPQTYALQGGRNRARPYEPLSLVLGHTKAIPDNANVPFAWFEGDDQYLSTMFHAGINCGGFSEVKLGDTAIETYEGVTISNYGFPANNSGTAPIIGTSVDSVEGAFLDAPTAPGPWVTRTTSPGTVRMAIDLELALSVQNEKGNYLEAKLRVELQYRVLGSTEWIGLDSQLFVNSSPKPMRRTLTYDVPAGQYEVRVRKFGDANYTGTGQSNVVSWTTLKSYQPDTADYGGQPRIQIQIKASGQLSGAPDEVNWIARAAPMPIWNGSAWVTASEPGAAGVSNPGAQILMLLRGIYRPSDGRLIAGAGLSDNRIDIESLKGFMVRCAQKGFRFDAMIQEAMNLQDLLESIAAAGLGSLSRHSGRIGVVWMAEDQPIEGVINMASMKAKSFSVQYDLVATADEYQLEFFDRDRSWTWQPVRVVAPGTVTPQRTSTENVRGVTIASHAAVIARFAMGQNIYGRKSISFEMDLEHLTVRRGSVLALSHDLTQWGYGGRVVSVTTAAGQFTVQVDEPVPTTVQATRTLGLRLSGEQQMRVFNVSAVSGDGRFLTVSQSWPAGAPVPGTQTAAADALWIYDFKATPGYRVRVISIEPADNMAGAQLTVVPETPEFWNYVLNGAYEPPPNNSLLVNQLPVVSNVRLSSDRIRNGDAWRTQLSVSFDVVGSYDHAQIWVATDGGPLEFVLETYGVVASWYPDRGTSWAVEVRPFDALGRQGNTASSAFNSATVTVPQVTNLALTVEPEGIIARFDPPAGLDSIDWSLTRVQIGSTWNLSAPSFQGKVSKINIGFQPVGTLQVLAAHKTTAGDWSTPVSASLAIVAPAQPLVTGSSAIDGVNLAWQDCRTTQPLVAYRISSGTTQAGATPRGSTLGTQWFQRETIIASRRYWVVAIDAGGNPSAGGYVELFSGGSVDASIDAATAEIQQGLDTVRDLVTDPANGLAAVQLLAEAAAQAPAVRYLEQASDLNALAQTTLRSLMLGNDGIRSTAVARSELYTKIDSDVSAEATQRVQLALDLAGQKVSLQQVAQVMADQFGNLSARYGVTLDVNGRATGFMLFGNNVQTDAVWVVDRFAIALPGNGPAVYPFVVGMVDGQPAVVVGGNLYADGAVIARHMASNSVTTGALAATAVTAEKMAVGSITAQNAAIANAAIDTLQVAGQAITVPAFISGFTNNLSMTYVIGGVGTFSVFILCSMVMSTVGTFRLSVDGNQVYQEEALGGTLACKGWALPMSAGTHTIQIFSDKPANSNGAAIYALATKR